MPNTIKPAENTNTEADLACAGCCGLEDCPCVKACTEERRCDCHLAAEARRWAAHFGLTDDMSRAERLDRLQAFAPGGRVVGDV